LKCVLAVASRQATLTCGIDQLCAGLQAGLDDDMHDMHALHHVCGAHHNYSYWGFILIDAQSNEMDITALLLTVHYIWTAGALFAFNSYNHWSTLIMC
jgi:hypothetical protein